MAKTTVWYDGECPFCMREIALMRRLDKRGAIEFVNAASDSAVCPLDRDILLARLHAMENGENGIMVSGAAAFAAMWRAIPVLRPLGLMARIPIILSILEWAYTLFLRVRPRIQRMMKAKKRS
jgi:predicted DCC family thiol-disulfide oxidoreductase YuxK